MHASETPHIRLGGPCTAALVCVLPAARFGYETSPLVIVCWPNCRARWMGLERRVFALGGVCLGGHRFSGVRSAFCLRGAVGFRRIGRSSLLLLFIGLLVHWQSWPLKRLARAAREMSLGADVAPVAEAGGSEVVEVSRAFNSMRERISRYLTERSQLFSAISHDLRTPITRLRLRVELLDDEAVQAKFSRDLDELEMLVKGALQCVKDTDIHENIEPVDLNQLLNCVIEPYLAPQGNGRVTLDGQACAAYPGKPLALKRCIGNLVDNALKYGERAHLYIEDDDQAFVLHVDDEGPGVPEQRLEQVSCPVTHCSENYQNKEQKMQQFTLSIRVLVVILIYSVSQVVVGLRSVQRVIIV